MPPVSVVAMAASGLIAWGKKNSSHPEKQKYRAWLLQIKCVFPKQRVWKEEGYRIEYALRERQSEVFFVGPFLSNDVFSS